MIHNHSRKAGSLTLILIKHSALNVMKIRKQRNQQVETPLLGLLPILLTWILIPLYLYLQPVILYHHLIPFTFYVGLINAYSVGQMITAHLVKADFPYGNALVVPLAYGLFDSLGPAIGAWPSALGDGVYQVAFVFLCLGLGIGVYGSFVVSCSNFQAGFNLSRR